MTQFLGFHIHDHHHLVALLQSGFNGISQPLCILFIYAHSVHYQFHSMVLITVQFHSNGKFFKFTVNPYIEVTFFSKILKQFLVMAFAVLN